MNESQTTSPNKSHRFFSWRGILFAIACVLTLIALFYAEENWRGRHAWQSYRRELEGKGEKLALRELIPAPAPDDKNLAMAPLLKPILDYTQGPAGVTWSDTNGLARLDRFNTALAPLNGTNLSLGRLERGTFADLTEWSRHYLNHTNPPPAMTEAMRRRYGLEPKANESSPPASTEAEFPAAPPGASPAQVVLTALTKLDAEFRELREAAAARPYCRFPVRYEDEPPVGVLLPHLARIKGISTVLLVRATAELEAGKPKEAFEDVNLALRLCDSVRDEPLIISQLVRAAIMGNCLQTLREGLVRHAWSDTQLKEFQAAFAPVNLLADYKLGMRGDRAGMLSELEYMRRHGTWGLDVGQFFQGADVCERVIRFGPSGWAYRNMLTFSRYLQDYALAAVDEQARRVFPEVSEQGTQALQTYSGPSTVFVRTTQTGFQRVLQRTGRMQTFVDAARVACALERYRLANNALPDTLSALTPGFIDRIPNDIVDGQPLRWKRNADGGYLLYSIGWNKKDDRGEFGWNRTDDTGVHGLMKESAGPWVDPTKGDWVWEMPAD